MKNVLGTPSKKYRRKEANHTVHVPPISRADVATKGLSYPKRTILVIIAIGPGDFRVTSMGFCGVEAREILLTIVVTKGNIVLKLGILGGFGLASYT